MEKNLNLRNGLIDSRGIVLLPNGNGYQWCGRRPSRPVSDQKIGLGLGLGLAGLVLCCETRSYTLVIIMILKDTATIYSFSILCLEHHHCGDQQWRSLNS